MSSKKSTAQDMYQQAVPDSLPVETVFSAISDNKSLSLFNIIGIMSGPASDGQPTGEILISRMNLTRKQYYHRINRLRSLGLIYRKKGRYSLSSLGRVVYETHKTIGVAIQNRWKLEALDSLESSPSAEGMPAENKIKIINALLEDHDDIKNMLLCHCQSRKDDYMLEV